jgi:hypothetical protein
MRILRLLAILAAAALPPAAAMAATAAPTGWGGPGQSLFQSLPALPTPPRAAGSAGVGMLMPGDSCRLAIAAAETRYGIPKGVLTAMALVESGRTNPATGQREPWPWSANAEGTDHVFETREQAVAWVRQAEAGGMRSIDTGCLQVNRKHHPGAFASLEAAFDPTANTDYAARFLVSLHDGPAASDWMRAAGMYHSQTPELANAYRERVQATLGQPIPGTSPRLPMMAALGANGGGQFLSNHPERATMRPAPENTPGKNLDSYRQHPVLIAVTNWHPAPPPAPPPARPPAAKPASAVAPTLK